MATIRLGRYEMESGKVPAVCMRCGRPASEWIRRKFSWRPDELISIGNPLRNMTVDVPVCDRHRNMWSRRVRINLVLFGGVFLSLVAMIFFASMHVKNDALYGFLTLSLFGLLFALAVFNIAFESSMIKATDIGDNGISLTRVSEDFVEALDQARKTIR